MHNPPHPGEVLRGLYLEPLGVSVTEAAKRLDVSRKALSELLNGRSGISSEMAVRLSIAFKMSPRVWMNLQVARDLWEAEPKRKKLAKVVREIAA